MKRANTLKKNITYLNETILEGKTLNIPLYTPKQLYSIEQEWFELGNPSYGLMQQAAWQIAMWIFHNLQHGLNDDQQKLKVSVWVGQGNNSGDGWLVATYLQKLGALVTVVEVAGVSTEDGKLAKSYAMSHNISVMPFSDLYNMGNNLENANNKNENNNLIQNLNCDVCVDALFGIGLDRIPQGSYEQAIRSINRLKKMRGDEFSIVSIDVPSGLVSRTGQVFNGCAVKADVTLCLIARKLGLHIKDASDYIGRVVDIPLIPSVLETKPIARLQNHPTFIERRESNTHKGSFGHTLILGGNLVSTAQGMGGAALLSASAAFAAGIGKLSVGCHAQFHSSLIATLPNAMSIDLHNEKAVCSLIQECDTVAIGMGFGRDDISASLFESYLKALVTSTVDIVIDADGLYHLSTLAKQNPQLIEQLKQHTSQQKVWFTPHSGEAARLLNTSVENVESDRIKAITKLADQYGGDWLLKGSGSVVLESGEITICGAGNPGMATAGMGDVLSGLAAGLLAQSTLLPESRSLRQAVLIHATAGDLLEQQMGTWALQASDMYTAIGKVMQQITN